jgi:5-methylcytosine-specific restriction protein A
LIDAAGHSQLPREPFAVEVPTEINSAQFFETAGTMGQVAVRRESDLVESFLASQTDRRFSRWAISLPAERTRLLTDVYDERDHVLYEAKAVAGRADLRLAVGQLYDYRRHIAVTDLRCSVLLPERPTADLRDLLVDAGLGLVFKDRTTFNFELAGAPHDRTVRDDRAPA